MGFRRNRETTGTNERDSATDEASLSTFVPYSLRLAIPWWVAPQHCPPLFHQPVNIFEHSDAVAKGPFTLPNLTSHLLCSHAAVFSEPLPSRRLATRSSSSLVGEPEFRTAKRTSRIANTATRAFFAMSRKIDFILRQRIRLQIDFFMRQRMPFRIDFFVRQQGGFIERSPTPRSSQSAPYPDTPTLSVYRFPDRRLAER
jgi:hypothetical protein